MKRIIFSDVHGNLEAYRSVLDAIDKEGRSEYLCVGDIVGYGADPSACIELTRQLKPVIVCGNHDWATAGLTPLENFNDYAGESLQWTISAISEEEKCYLGSLKLTYTDKEMTLVHGTLPHPDLFEYVFDLDTAYRMMSRMETKICFIGHSHTAGVFILDDGKLNYTRGPMVKIDKDKKYLVNAGSVGQPRDGDWRGAYCVWDKEKGVIEIKRAEYDIKKTQKKIIEAGLPGILAARLSEGR